MWKMTHPFRQMMLATESRKKSLTMTPLLFLAANPAQLGPPVGRLGPQLGDRKKLAHEYGRWEDFGLWQINN